VRGGDEGRTPGKAAGQGETLPPTPCLAATSSGVRGQGQRSAVIVVCKRLLRPSDFGRQDDVLCVISLQARIVSAKIKFAPKD
jgi:hypothetical protein